VKLRADHRRECLRHVLMMVSDLGSNPSPNDVCWSNCDAVAECGRYALPEGKKCPLNVCCSKYGFCGMTDDFCAAGTGNDADSLEDREGCQSNCNQPGSGASGGDVQSRVIGYYEAWAHDRDCQSMDFQVSVVPDVAA
jgi:chitinase